MKQSDIFLLPVDEDRSIMLAAMCGLAILHEGFIDVMKEYEIKPEEVETLFNEINDKIHEHGWCKSTECDYNENN